MSHHKCIILCLIWSKWREFNCFTNVECICSGILLVVCVKFFLPVFSNSSHTSKQNSCHNVRVLCWFGETTYSSRLMMEGHGRKSERGHCCPQRSRVSFMFPTTTLRNANTSYTDDIFCYSLPGEHENPPKIKPLNPFFPPSPPPPVSFPSHVC